MRKSAYRPMTMKDLVAHFAIPRPNRQAFKKIIRELTASGEVIAVKGKRYGLPKKMNLVVGRLMVHPDGFGFVRPEEGEGDRDGDVFIKTRDLNTAMDGDRVVVRLERFGRGERLEGRIIRILERARNQVVGRFERFSAYGYLTPYNPHLIADIYVPIKAALNARTGDMAVAEIVNFASRNRVPEGKVIEVLGSSGEAGVDEAVVIREHGLPHRFSSKALAEARNIPQTVEDKDRRRRLDLRRLFTVTIDGETAKDFDDAVSLELSPKKTYHLWVHIADVGHYVKPGTALDEEAKERATSVYFPGMVVPMLPEELSNGICSLNPGVDRLAFSVFMEYDRHGALLRYDFAETVIRSMARMTYTEVRDILQGKAPATDLPPKAGGAFAIMSELAEILHQARRRKGSIDFDLPEAEIILDLRGNVQDIYRRERNAAHRVVEEFMLAANRTVAASAAALDQPFLYRVHEEPDAEKIDFFRRFVSGFGYSLPPGKVKPLQIADLLGRLEGKKEAPVINNLLLRSMKQARYSDDNAGHYGLAFDTYTHFTSPIRRYPDLAVHRLLKTIIRQGRLADAAGSDPGSSLATLAEHCSERERRAMEAEREIIQLKKIHFMTEKTGEEFDGFITGVASFGIFVELCDFMVEGLVHVSSLSDDYYLFDEESQVLRGDHTKKTFRVGDQVRVKVARVNRERRHIDFALLDAAGTKVSGGNRARRRDATRRKRVRR